jgi:hypothetical protein
LELIRGIHEFSDSLAHLLRTATDELDSALQHASGRALLDLAAAAQHIGDASDFARKIAMTADALSAS